MKRFLKIFIIIILIFIVLLAILPFAFKGKIKELVLKEANKNLNATLQVGAVKLSFIRNFPNVYIGLDDVVIIGNDDFRADTLVNLKSFSVSTGLFDVLGGSPYSINKIRLDKADVLLKVLADGSVNWDIVKSSGTEIQPEETSAEPDNFRLNLKSLRITDSRFVYDDKAGAVKLVFDGLNHSLSGDLGASFTSLVTSTSVRSATLNYDGLDYLLRDVLNLTADIDADLDKSVYTFKENELKINDFGLKFNGSVGMPADGYDLDLSFASSNSTFKQLLSLVPAIYTRDFDAVKTDGKFNFNGMVKGIYTDESYPAFKLNLNVADAWFQYPDLPSSVKDINITANIESTGGDLDNTVVNVEKFSLDMAGNPVVASLLLKKPISDPYVDTKVSAKVNLGDVGKFYPLEEGENVNGNIDADFSLKGKLSDVEAGRYGDFDAEGTVKTAGIKYKSPYFSKEITINSARFSITPAFLDMPEFNAKAGRSDVSLHGRMDNYLGYYLKNETLTGKFSLSSGILDINELMDLPSGAETTNSGSAIVDTTTNVSTVEVPAGIDFTLNASASEVDYMDFRLNDFRGTVIIKNQKLFLDDISVNALGGKIAMNGSYDAVNPANPAVDLSLGLVSLSLPEVYRSFGIAKSFAPIAEKMLGDISGSINMKGLLDGQMMPQYTTLTGGGKLSTSGIQVSNVNTLNQLSNSLKMDQLKEMKLSAVSVVFQLLNGVMEVKPFDFRAMGIDMNLGGKTSVDESIDYVLKMKIPRSMMGGAANSVVNDLVAKAGKAGADIKMGDYVNVDALIGGTITDPKVGLNLAGMGKGLVESVKEQVKEQVGQKVEEVKEQAKEEAEKYLQEADKQAQAILDEAQRQSDAILKTAQNLADETRKQASANADKIVNEAKGKGFIAEAAAKKSADEVKKQGEKQAQNILSEAQKKSDALLTKARQEADKVKADARQKINQ